MPALAAHVEKQTIVLDAQSFELDYKNNNMIYHKVRIAEGNMSVAADQAQIDNAKLQLTYSRITAIGLLGRPTAAQNAGRQLPSTRVTRSWRVLTTVGHSAALSAPFFPDSSQLVTITAISRKTVRRK